MDMHHHQVLFKIENELTLRHNMSDYCLLLRFLQIVLVKWSRNVDVSRPFFIRWICHRTKHWSVVELCFYTLQKLYHLNNTDLLRPWHQYWPKILFVGPQDDLVNACSNFIPRQFKLNQNLHIFS